MNKEQIQTIINEAEYEILAFDRTSKVVSKKLINALKQLALCNVVDTLPADDLIKSLGEAKEPNEYILKTHNGVWWLEHKHVGSAEPLKQWLTDKAVSG